MAKKPEITFECRLILADGMTDIPLAERTEEQDRAWREGYSRRLTENMGDYYRRHKEDAVRRGVWEAVTAGWPVGYWDEKQTDAFA